MNSHLKSSPQDVVGYVELTVGARIKTYRELMELTQKQLEECSGVKQSVISAIERDKKSMGLTVARKLAAGLGINVSRLVDEEAVAAPEQDLKRAVEAMAEQIGASADRFLDELLALAGEIVSGRKLTVQKKGSHIAYKAMAARKATVKKVPAKKKVVVKRSTRTGQFAMPKAKGVRKKALVRKSVA